MSDFLTDRYEVEGTSSEVRLPYHKYKLATIRSHFKKGRLPAPLEKEFVTHLGTQNRLGGDARDRVHFAAAVLQDDEPQELKLSEIFRKAFGQDVILNRTGQSLAFT